jgi:hypothetical protein
MHPSKPITAFRRGSTKLIQLFASTAISLALIITVASSIRAQTPTPDSKTKSEATTSVKAEPLSGVELWAMNCSRCHMARNPGEFTAAQWQTIFRHMRVRANLPAAQARELQKYLEAGAGK